MRHFIATFACVIPLIFLTTGNTHAQSAEQTDKRIAITIDDVPMASTSASLQEVQRVNAALLRHLNAFDVQAFGFVNEDRVLRDGEVDERLAVLESWLTGGMELGNHTFNHVGMHSTPLADYQDAVVKGEVLTRMLTEKHKQPLRYFRHPYTQTGNSLHDKKAFEAFLDARGYQVAPFTIEHNDYLFACVYDKVTTAADKKRVVEAYLAHLKNSVKTYEIMSSELFGRQIPQIFLIHDSALNADTMDQTLKTFQDLGYRFITLEEAMKAEQHRFG